MCTRFELFNPLASLTLDFAKVAIEEAHVTAMREFLRNLEGVGTVSTVTIYTQSKLLGGLRQFGKFYGWLRVLVLHK